MLDRYTTIIVCCEDLQQHVFIYRCLREKGANPRRVRIEKYPREGDGDGKQFVRERHVKEVKAMRSKPHLTLGLISMMDADADTVVQRKGELDAALEAVGEQGRQPQERIAVMIPRRNIETWIHGLLGEAVNETDEYPRFRGEERECAAAAEEFAKRCPAGMRQTDRPSLRDGCAELSRLL